MGNRKEGVDSCGQIFESRVAGEKSESVQSLEYRMTSHYLWEGRSVRVKKDDWDFAVYVPLEAGSR